MPEPSRSLKLATIWLLIGIAVFLAVLAMQRQQRLARFTTTGGVVELRRGADGHYHWPGSVNGVAVDFMIDTGATTTALPGALARRARLRPEGVLHSSTAGGEVRGELAVADVVLDGGVRAERLRVAVLPDLATPLLGMDVLSKLRWSQQGQRLRVDTSAPR